MGKNPLEEMEQKSEMQNLGAISKTTEWSKFAPKTD